jgi:hypothetical protein
MNRQAQQVHFNDMGKLPTMHKKIFNQHQNTMGERMGAEFQNFLQK